MGRLFTPATLGPRTLRNRVIKAATFEGMTPQGRISPALVAHHRALGAGGVAMTTVAYAAVDPDGRTFADQLCPATTSAADLRRLVDAVHDTGAAVALQLSHAGFFSRLRRRDGSWPRGPSPGINKYGAASGLPYAPAMSADEVAAIPSQFAATAAIAADAGFDAVELHLGHGYLLSQFLSPATNHRRDAWGGTRQARMRLPLQVVRAVKDRVGTRCAVTAKINTDDGFTGGATVEDGIALAEALDAAGIDAITTSGGFTSRNPLYLLRGGRPLGRMVEVERNPTQRWALRVLGPAVLRRYPFAPMFFREAGRRILARVKCPVILLGGVVSRDDIDLALDDGFAFVQMGRALIADPDLVARFEAGTATRTRCNACNECMAEMEAGGVRCVLDGPRHPPW